MRGATGNVDVSFVKLFILYLYINLRFLNSFSRRQSRAAEITNEIPTYRDPFKYNIWEPLYLNPRILGE